MEPEGNKVSIEKAKDNKEKFKLIKERVKQNKAFFYGLPIVVLVSIFASLVFIIIPTIYFYFDSRSQNEKLDQNILNVNKSIENLDAVYKDYSKINEYDDKLTEYIPEESKLGEVLNLIQTKAKDFNLESKVDVSRGSSRTSLDNLARKTQDDKALFDSISSGEIIFQPKSLNKDVNAILLSIEVNVRGNKSSFLDFLKEMEGVKPVVNLVFIEYSENRSNPAQPTVSALLRFESYSLKLKSENPQQPKQLSKESPELISQMPVESFDVKKGIVEKLEGTVSN